MRSEDIIRKDNGDKLRGLSQNQLCIGVATDKKHTLFLLEGTGKPSKRFAITSHPARQSFTIRNPRTKNWFANKVELVIKMAFQNPKLLRFRDYFPDSKGF